MGASRNHATSLKSTNTSLFGRAIAHPARIEILEQLIREKDCTNVQFCKHLKLTKSTVHSHLKKLGDAGLITMDFYPNCYLINLSDNKKTLVESVLSEFA